MRNCFDCFGSLDKWYSNCIVRGNNEKVETWELFHWIKWSKRIKSWAKNAVPAKVRTQHLINNWPYLAVKKLHLMRWLFELTMWGAKQLENEMSQCRLECQSASRACSTKSPFWQKRVGINMQFNNRGSLRNRDPNLRCDFSIQPLYTLPKRAHFCWLISSPRPSFPLHFPCFSPCHTSEGCGALKHRKVTVEKGARPNLEPAVVGKFTLHAGKGLFIGRLGASSGNWTNPISLKTGKTSWWFFTTHFEKNMRNVKLDEIFPGQWIDVNEFVSIHSRTCAFWFKKKRAQSHCIPRMSYIRFL